ncbi:deazaflavin-dependent oxidoreductase (nitroreductase family) [Haloactinopolyspora alba]|uniref:Deazaflavin-dependent oxidoreductase (Nitroreductase family) n=2 Tax=Haloactinopolyspora alba TaxID=648780 RepID=A0A2P8EBL5_9ACTN|nr:deazaflavin-dependent oxidoreductase (nitroreductase family) [Haloactinopolyspora alba]
MRAPIWIYRARLGFLFGSRLLLLEHVGRRSGLARYVVLEVAARPEAGSYVVVSGLGPSSQWFRNVLAEPRVRISVGRHHRRPAWARQLDVQEARGVFATYAAAHPRTWRVLEPVVEQAADVAGASGGVPVVELRLT